jgi:hypothetical protein
MSLRTEYLNSVLGLLHRENVGGAADVSEVHADPVLASLLSNTDPNYRSSFIDVDFSIVLFALTEQNLIFNTLYN